MVGIWDRHHRICTYPFPVALCLFSWANGYASSLLLSALWILFIFKYCGCWFWVNLVEGMHSNSIIWTWNAWTVIFVVVRRCGDMLLGVSKWHTIYPTPHEWGDAPVAYYVMEASGIQVSFWLSTLRFHKVISSPSPVQGGTIEINAHYKLRSINYNRSALELSWIKPIIPNPPPQKQLL